MKLLKQKVKRVGVEKWHMVNLYCSLPYKTEKKGNPPPHLTWIEGICCHLLEIYSMCNVCKALGSTNYKCSNPETVKFIEVVHSFITTS